VRGFAGGTFEIVRVSKIVELETNRGRASTPGAEEFDPVDHLLRGKRVPQAKQPTHLLADRIPLL